jgi:serine/threonine protein kinase
MEQSSYNLIFNGFDKSLVFVENVETKISELIKIYFKRIEKSNLVVNNVSNIYFLYNGQTIQTNDYDKTISEYFVNGSTIYVMNKYKEYNYEIIDTISQTQFTSIYKAKLLNHKNKDEFIAVKKIFKDKIKKQMKYIKHKKKITEEDFKSEIQKFNKEIKNMEICQCENSVKIYDFFDKEKEFEIIMELCDKNLFDILLERKKGFNAEEIKNI